LSKQTEKFYKTYAWQKVRQQALSRSGYLCEECLKNGIYNSENLFVHHIINLNPSNIDNPEIALNVGNLKVVCKAHHEMEHHSNVRYVVDEFGEIIN